MTTIHHYHFELIDHMPYSSDLAHSDFHLFPNMKKHLAHFTTDFAVMAAAGVYLKHHHHVRQGLLLSRHNGTAAIPGEMVELRGKSYIKIITCEKTPVTPPLYGCCKHFYQSSYMTAEYHPAEVMTVRLTG